MLNVLDLFSGIGGFSLGLERTGGFRTVAFCEIEEFPRKVLRKHWPDVPIFEDVRKLHAEDLPKPVDIICGGYPCQPFSLAGKRKGTEDYRHLWPEIARLLREFDAIGRKPAWCLFENVAGHVNMGLDQVLADLESQGYTAWPVIVPACSVDAPHRRDRVWVICNSKRCRLSRIGRWRAGAQLADGCTDVPNPGCQLSQERAEGKRNWRRGDVEQHGCIMADSFSEQSEGWMYRSERWKRSEEESSCDGWAGRGAEDYRWPTEPNVGRVAHGVPSRVDRLKALGNAVVPQVVEVIGRAILEAENLN